MIQSTLNRSQATLLTQVLSMIDPLLIDFERHVLELEARRDPETWFSLFQPLHQIMGSGQFLDQTLIELIPRQLLDLLEDIRQNNSEIFPDIVDELLEITQNFRTVLSEFQSHVEQCSIDPEGMLTIHWQSPLLESLKTQIQKLLTGFEINPPSASKEPLPTQFTIEWPPGIKEDFLAEAEEGLLELEDILLTLESDPHPFELYHSLFRRLHSLKGNTGVMLATIPDESIRLSHSLTPFHDLAHQLESLVALYRDQQQVFSPTSIDLLLQTLDALKALLIPITQDKPCQMDLHPLFLSLKKLSGSGEDTQSPNLSSQTPVSPKTMAFLNTAEQCLEMLTQAIEESFHESQQKSALKKYRRGLKTLHKATKTFQTERSTDSLTDQAGNPDPDIHQTVQNLFDDFNSWESEEPLSGQALKDRIQPYLVRLHEAMRSMKPRSEGGMVKETLIKETSAFLPASSLGESAFVRVPQKQIDRLMNLIGELAISKNSFEALTQELKREYQLPKMAQKMKQTGGHVGRIADELQDMIMHIRMVSVKTLFSRFSRLIRDLSRTMDKPLRLLTAGEDTQLDKSLLEQISNPLMHLLRNSADHGIESPEERRRLGKPEQGTLILSAQRKGHFVSLEVRDDGQGLHREQIAAKGISMGLITSQDLENMEDQAVYNLVFHPGFSTTHYVTEVSGRGVGMDVVRSTVEKMGGKISMTSKAGEGTCMELAIPESLALTRGLIVEVGGTRFVLPLDSVKEMVKVPATMIKTFKETQMIEIRGKVLPVVCLAKVFGLQNLESLSTKSNRTRLHKVLRSLVIITVGDRIFVLEVEKFLHEVEIMVKPLEGNLGHIPGITGTTILSDGKILLVLNPAELMFNV